MIVGSLLATIEALTYSIARHVHGKEIWFGANATVASLTPYRLTSGSNDFGAAVQLLAAADLPIVSDCTRFDLHRINPVAVSEASTYLVRLIWGSGTVAEAEAAFQYTTVSITPSSVGVNTFWAPIDVLFPRLPCGQVNVWAKAKNVTLNATLDIIFGLHEYDR